MIIWLTIQLYQALFGVAVNGEGMYSLRAFGFIELLLEVIGLLVLAATFIYYYADHKREQKEL